MEDDNGLELSLGLCCGGSSGKYKIKEASSDPKADEGGSNRLLGGNMTVADSSFKNFFQMVTENQDLKGKQKSGPDNTQQNFWTDLGKCSTPVTDHSNDAEKNITQFNRYQELWPSNSKTADTEEEKSNKRKMPFEEINLQNKHGKVAEYAGTHGVNGDVAETVGSNSWMVSQHEEKSKSSDIPKFSDKHVTIESSVGFSSPCAIPPLAVTNSERPAVQTMNTTNLQLSFGYSPVQLPTLETGSSWAFNSPVPRHVTSIVNINGPPDTENSEGLKASQETGPSAPQIEDQSKGTFPLFRQKEKSNKSVAAGVSHEGSIIRPGMASDVKFGGSGSHPDLPWVSTTGPGPNGKTISGVTYKYNQNEVRIVCSCHGTHDPGKVCSACNGGYP